MNPAIYIIQSWKVERWSTFYVNSYLPDAEEVFADIVRAAPERTFRFVKLAVSDFDFLNTYARDVQVLALSEGLD